MWILFREAVKKPSASLHEARLRRAEQSGNVAERKTDTQFRTDIINTVKVKSTDIASVLFCCRFNYKNNKNARKFTVNY